MVLEKEAKDAAQIFAQNSLAGVYSHGLNRFPRVIEYLQKGEIDPQVTADCVLSMGAFERWDGHQRLWSVKCKAGDGPGLWSWQSSMASVLLLWAITTTGCGAEAMAGRQQIRDASESVGLIPVLICRPGAVWTERLEITR